MLEVHCAVLNLVEIVVIEHPGIAAATILRACHKNLPVLTAVTTTIIIQRNCRQFDFNALAREWSIVVVAAKSTQPSVMLCP